MRIILFANGKPPCASPHLLKLPENPSYENPAPDPPSILVTVDTFQIPKCSKGPKVTIVPRIATPTFTILVTVDTLQIKKKKHFANSEML